MILAVGMIAVSIYYYKFISQMIYQESTAHLTEIYHQANQSLYNLVSKNWSTMKMWVPYLRDIEDPELVDEYIENACRETGFTDFYFISREGSYRTVSGKTGYLDLKDSLSRSDSEKGKCGGKLGRTRSAGDHGIRRPRRSEQLPRVRL